MIPVWLLWTLAALTYLGILTLIWSALAVGKMADEAEEKQRSHG